MQFVAEFLPRFSSAVLFTTVDAVGVVQFIPPSFSLISRPILFTSSGFVIPLQVCLHTEYFPLSISGFVYVTWWG